MNENEDITQGLVDCAEDEEKLALNFLKGLQLFASEKYDKPQFTLYQNGVGFAPLGNIMAICAEMKNGKTWLMLQLAATLLRQSKKFGPLTSDEAMTPRVLWFDTEQDKYDTMLIMRRIHQLCGWDYNTDNPNFQIYNLRSIKHEDRRKALHDAVQYLKPTVVFLDGIRDLIGSFNDEEESFSLIEELMKITEDYNCSIWSVLHVNPNSEKMRGHLGTELGNKVTDVFNVKKGKDEVTGQVTFEVNQIAARHRDVDGWMFRILDVDGQYSVPEILTQAEAKAVEVDRVEELRTTIAKYIGDGRAVSKTALKDELTKGEHIGGKRAWQMIEEGLSCKVLEITVNNKIRLVGKPVETKQEEMPF